MPSYKPMVSNVRMSDYGYWVVTLSASPTQRLSIMIAKVGITPEEAASLALHQVTLAKVARQEKRD